MNETELYLMHYGMPRRSGRYPYGSGDRPFQSLEKKDVKNAIKGKSRSEKFRSEHTIPKGTTLYRTTIKPNEKIKGSTYITYMQPDRDLYRGGAIRNQFGGDVKTYEREMVLKEDLNVPSRQHYRETMMKIVEENTKLVDEAVTSFWEEVIPKGSIDRYEITTDWNTGKTNEKLWDNFLEQQIKETKDLPLENAYSTFVMSLGKAEKLKAQLIDTLKKEGYNAMVDEAGVGARVAEGIDPLIVFDFDKSISSVSTREITADEEERARKEYADWQRRARVNSQGKVW